MPERDPGTTSGAQWEIEGPHFSCHHGRSVKENMKSRASNINEGFLHSTLLETSFVQIKHNPIFLLIFQLLNDPIIYKLRKKKQSTNVSGSKMPIT